MLRHKTLHLKVLSQLVIFITAITTGNHVLPRMMERISTYYRTLAVATVMSWLTFTPAHSKIIDLSFSQDSRTLYWPGMPTWNLTTLHRGLELNDSVWLEYNSYSGGEHGGTHMDAPRHLFPDGYDVNDIPLEDTIAEGVMVLGINESRENPAYAVTIERLFQWESIHGRIPDRAAVLFNFGWATNRWHSNFLYLNTLTPNNMSSISYPHLTVEAARWLVDQRDVKIVGLDTPSPDLPTTPGLPAHSAILGRNRLILENVNITSSLPATGFRLHATPIKTIGGTGMQTRVFAILPDDDEV